GGHGAYLLGRVVGAVELAEFDDAAVVLGDFDDAAFGVVDGDGLAGGPEVEAVYGFVVLADVLVALGGAGVAVEGDAGADDIDEGGALVGDGGLDEGEELVLVAAEAAGDEARAHEEGEADGVDGGVFVGHAFLRLGPLVGGGGEL